MGGLAVNRAMFSVTYLLNGIVLEILKLGTFANKKCGYIAMTSHELNGVLIHLPVESLFGN